MSEQNPGPEHQEQRQDNNEHHHQGAKPSGVTFWQAFFSAIAAAFGVQSDKNRQKDFSGSSPWPYIIAGLVFTLVFIGILVALVNVVLG